MKFKSLLYLKERSFLAVGHSQASILDKGFSFRPYFIKSVMNFYTAMRLLFCGILKLLNQNGNLFSSFVFNEL